MDNVVVTNPAPMFYNILTDELRAKFDPPKPAKPLYKVFAYILEEDEEVKRVDIARDLERHEAIGAIKAYKTLFIFGNRKQGHIYCPAPASDLYREMTMDFKTKVMIFGQLQ